MSQRPLVAIVGPTASGKSAVALELARRFDGETVNADPQQFFRGMDIGTAKPTAAERAAAPHHLLDIINPDERVGLGLFQQLARAALADVWGRGHLPILVGGSGQYVWGLLEGWTVPPVPPDEDLRRRLEERARLEGNQVLHEELAAVDPEAAAAIHVNNVRRVIRALEVYERTGKPISSCQARSPLEARTLVIGLRSRAEELGARIDRRTRQMFAEGFAGEVRALLDQGYEPDLPSLNSIGYRQVVAHLRGDLSLEEAEFRTAKETRRLARRQLAWFKPRDERINWFAPDAIDAMIALVGEHLGAGEASTQR